MKELQFIRVRPDGVVRQTLAETGFSGAATIGAHKLAQRFLLQLMTPKGSIPHAPSRGSSFLLWLRTGNVTNEETVLAAFAAAQLELRAALKQQESADDPNDERFHWAILRRLTVQPDGLNMEIEVFSRAGTRVRLVWPLRFQLR